MKLLQDHLSDSPHQVKPGSFKRGEPVMAFSTCNVDLLGNHYEYAVLPFDAAWNDVGGVYIFVKWSGKKRVALYVGKADSFKSRLCASHECWSKAVALGATHVLARAVSEPTRTNEERALIQAYDPPLNVQHRRSFLSGA
jgi:hypothetical protein